MSIEILKRFSADELIAKVRGVPLKKNEGDESPPIFVYQHAQIGLRQLHPQEVNPTSFYLLRKNLMFQRELRAALMLDHEIDTLALSEGLEIRVTQEDGSSQIWGLIPPVIEVTPRFVRYRPLPGEIEHNGVQRIEIPIINDGLHRVALAREERVPFTGLVVSGADHRYPFYAHPNGWEQVKVVDDVPATKDEKKLYTRENCTALYRDFGVLGCGAPRGLGTGK